MKTNKFWFVMAAAAILTGMTMMTSCSKDDEPELPEVIESEVLDEGIDATVKENVGTDNTQLSYESWIVVKGQTRAAFENKVSVTLTNQLENVKQDIRVDNFDFGQSRVSTSFGVRDEKVKKDFVTISDSVMFYKIEHNNFSFTFELPYQVGVYYDGITRQTMPYHRYGKVVDKGYTVTDLGVEIEDLEGKGQNVRVNKLYKHQISVDFNGRSYDVVANLTLKRTLQTNSDKTVIKCELIDSGTTSIENQESRTTYTSWIKVKQTMLNGSVQEKTYTVTDMQGYLDRDLLGYKSLENKDIKLLTTSINPVSDKVISTVDDFVAVHEVERNYQVNYNYFMFNLKVIHYEAVYDDGVTTMNFPSFKHENFTDAHSLTSNGEYTENGVTFEDYFFTHKLTADFGSVKHTGVRDFQVVVAKK